MHQIKRLSIHADEVALYLVPRWQLAGWAVVDVSAEREFEILEWDGFFRPQMPQHCRS